MSNQPTQPEAWLRGPLPGIIPDLQPVAHALVQAAEDLERFTRGLTAEELHARPGRAASVAFHMLHMAGSLDRLFTYARGEPLSEEQRAALAAERDSGSATAAPSELSRRFRDTVDRAMAQLRATPAKGLDDERLVGRAGTPSTLRGLLYHAAEHTARHAGQINTTLLALRGKGLDA